MEPIVVNLMEPLKPCPFCGGEAETSLQYHYFTNIDYWIMTTVYCPKCHVEISKTSNCYNDLNKMKFSQVLQLMADVIYKWNNRNETDKDK